MNALIRRELMNELCNNTYEPSERIARRYLIKRIMRECRCSEYAVMKQLKADEDSGHIISMKYNNKVFVYENPDKPKLYRNCSGPKIDIWAEE